MPVRKTVGGSIVARILVLIDHQHLLPSELNRLLTKVLSRRHILLEHLILVSLNDGSRFVFALLIELSLSFFLVT